MILTPIYIASFDTHDVIGGIQLHPVPPLNCQCTTFSIKTQKIIERRNRLTREVPILLGTGLVVLVGIEALSTDGSPQSKPCITDFNSVLI